jgi:hypothetical protein
MMTIVMVVNDYSVELTSEVFPCRLVCEAINCYIVLSRYRILDSNLCLDRLEAFQLYKCSTWYLVVKIVYLLIHSFA